MTQHLTKSQIIAQLNDKFRADILQEWMQNKLVITQGIAALSSFEQMDILHKVSQFSNFNENNDPYGEHDFGNIRHRGKDIFWKIDYYDKSMKYGSEDPSDPSKTNRLMTVMLSCEY